MEHFQELQKAIAHQQKIAEYITRLKSMGYMEQRDTIGITQGDNRRYTLRGIADLIGEEKLDAIIEQFAGLIALELHKKQQQAAEQVGRYQITHTPLQYPHP